MKDLVSVVLLAAVVSWLTAQLLKVVIYAIKNHVLRIERLWGAGGMPSSHSSFVCALAIMTCRIEGLNSVEASLAMCFAFIVMYDACGVRREAGQHAREINRLRRIVEKFDIEIVEKVDEEIDMESEEPILSDKSEKGEKELKEFVGHTPLQVMCGALLGILIGLVFPIW